MRIEEAYEKLGVSKGKDLDYYTDVYRDLIKEHHPDLGGSRDEFVKIQEAYELIKEAVNEESVQSNVIDEVINDSSSKKSDYSKYVYPSKVRYIDYMVLRDVSPSANKLFQEWDSYTYESMGGFTIKSGETVLEAAESNDNTWPYSCRGGACSNCAIKVVNGSVETRSIHILPSYLLDKGYRLSCIGKPLSKNIDIVYNINQHDDIQEYLLPDRS